MLGARRAYQESLRISRWTGSRHGQALNVYYLGALRSDLGQLALARRHLAASLRLSQEGGLYQGQLLARAHLAFLNAVAGNGDSAEVQLSHALVLAAHTSDQRLAAEAFNHAGETCRILGDPGKAIGHHTTALAAARAVRYRRGEILALLGVARAHRAAGHGQEAEAVGRQTMELAQREGYGMTALRSLLVVVGAARDESGGTTSGGRG